MTGVRTRIRVEALVSRYSSSRCGACDDGAGSSSSSGKSRRSFTRKLDDRFQRLGLHRPEFAHGAVLAAVAFHELPQALGGNRKIVPLEFYGDPLGSRHSS